MSNATPEPRSPPPYLPTPIDATVTRWARLIVAGVHGLAFWSAIVLPLVSLALLYGGISGGQTHPFLGLVALNVVCLVLGHEHSP